MNNKSWDLVIISINQNYEHFKEQKQISVIYVSLNKLFLGKEMLQLSVGEITKTFTMELSNRNKKIMTTHVIPH